MNAHDLNTRLLERIEDVCNYLLPDGKRERDEWRCGSVEGGSGKSFGVRLSGSRAGYWNDLNPSSEEDSGKSLVSLWRRSRGYSPDQWAKAHDEIREWLGMPEYEPKGATRAASKPFKKPDQKLLRTFKQGDKALEYLILDREIAKWVLEKNKDVCRTSDGEAVSFLHRDSKGDVCYVNNLAVERGPEGQKKMWAQAGGKLSLFGKPTVPEDAEYLVICEGQIDQLSWMQYRHPCVSVPNGAKNDGWVEEEWDWLKRFVKIYIAFDNDKDHKAGEEGAKKLAKRLGMERCWMVQYPDDYKDANDMLKGGEETFDYLLEDAQECKPSEVRCATEWDRPVWETFFGVEKDEPGIPYPLPFPGKIATNYGSVVLCTGYKKHGKTAFLWQTAAWLAAKGKNGFIASFEVDPKQAVHKFLRSGLAGAPKNNEEYSAAMSQYASKLMIYDKTGRVDWKHLLETMKFCYAKYGTFYFIIDSFMRLSIPAKDSEAVSEFMNALCDFVHETGVHVFLVAHSRKPDTKQGGEGVVPTSDMVRGAGELSDNVWQQFAIWRNFKKEEERNDAIESGSGDTKWVSKPDAIIHLQFQRYYEGATRKLSLNFSNDACQFYEVGSVPVRYFDLDLD